MKIEYVKQTSKKSQCFWQPTLKQNENGTVTLLPCIYYFGSLEINIPEETWMSEEGDRIYIENNVDPLHLIKQAGGMLPSGEVIEDEYTPLSGDKKSSPGPVIWVEQGVIYVLTHEEEDDNANI